MQEINELDRAFFELKTLAEKIGAKPTLQEITGVAENVVQYGIDRVRAGCQAYLRVGKFFPKPVELINLIESGNLDGEKPTRVPPPRIEPMRPSGIIGPATTVDKQRIINRIWDEAFKSPNFLRHAWKGSRLLSGGTPFTKAFIECLDEIVDPGQAAEWQEQLDDSRRIVGGWDSLAGSF